MVLGRGLGHCTTLGEAGNVSEKLNMIIARSELELKRRALSLRHAIGAERLTMRHHRNQKRQEEMRLQNLIIERARMIQSLSSQVSKKNHEALKNEIIAFSVAGNELREARRGAATKRLNIDEEQLHTSMANFDRRKLLHAKSSDGMQYASRGLLLGDEHCICDLNVPIGVHKMQLCHGAVSEDNCSDLDDPSMLDRRRQEQRKAAYNDSVDLLGRIQGFRKKLQSLEAARTELRGRYAEAVDSKHRLISATKDEAAQASSLSSEEAQRKVNETRRALRILGDEIQSKKNAMEALERKHYRAQNLMLRRSILANRFFRQERYRVLLNGFDRWKYYKDWSVKTRTDIEMKQRIIMQDIIGNSGECL